MTLALSFFLAGLEQDADLANKIVVFDDPFTSQDVYRRRQTGHEIMRVARACKQLIVLSHDPPFSNSSGRGRPRPNASASCCRITGRSERSWRRST